MRLPLALLICSLPTLAYAQTPKGPAMALLADTVVDTNALNFPTGKWGTCINGQTFQQEALLTHKGYQYAAYFADPGVVCLARRKLADGKWETLRLDDYKIRDHKDVHNVVTLGICGTDGSIHLFFDHHCEPLHYRRSIAGVASKPEQTDWKPELFSKTTSTLPGVGEIKDLTYPQVYSTPNGGVQVLYRTGYSGNGDWHIAEYDGKTEKWASLGRVIAKEGAFDISPNRCAYPNPMRFDAKGVLHMTWTFREQPKGKPFDLRTNHDLYYAFSDDLGRTWKDNAGKPIAAPTGEKPTAIDINTPGIKIASTKWLWGQMNTTTQAIDAKNRVHVLNWQQPHDAKEGNANTNTWRYYHYVRDENGKWTETLLPFVGRKPQILVGPDHTAYVIYAKAQDREYHNTDPGAALEIMAATEASKWTDWKSLWKTDRLSVGEPLVDPVRWGSEKILSIYTQDKPTAPGKPSSLRVLDFKP